jgi:hypothetical protein
MQGPHCRGVYESPARLTGDKVHFSRVRRGTGPSPVDGLLAPQPEGTVDDEV